jgi:K+-sensing histidine kinase KdpD
MRDDYETMFYLPAGPIAAIVLGMVLVPLREFTNSANFTFAFLVLIIVVAEFGGRWAGVATATCSALSLNFFLTRPYLSLKIEGKHDIIAFCGLTVCGLVAAAFGSRRGEAVRSLRTARTHLDLLHSAFRGTAEAEPLKTRLEEALRACREALPLEGLVIRNNQGDVVAASGQPQSPRPAPVLSVRPETLLPEGDSGSSLPPRGLPLPVEGVSLPLMSGGRQVGWLDLWGDGTTASLQTRRTLSDVAGLLAGMIAST